MTAFIDSSAWIDYFLGMPNAKPVKMAIESDEKILTSPLNLLEVYFKLLRFYPNLADEKADFICSRAELAVADRGISLEAARLKVRRGLATVDAVVWASAERHGARLFTSDRDFRGYKQLELLR